MFGAVMSDLAKYQFPVFDEWTLYDRIVRRDYMKHEAISVSVAKALSEGLEELDVLDLGCGCGLMAAKILRELKVRNYTGVDLSEAGLSRVQQSLRGITEHIQVKKSDLVSFLQQNSSLSPTLLLASYSLHHFPFDELSAILKEIQATMNPLGFFVWIDPMRQSHESRDEFIRRFMYEISTQWEDLDSSELREVEEHISTSDYPLDEEEQRSLLSACGFESVLECYRDTFYSAKIVR